MNMLINPNGRVPRPSLKNPFRVGSTFFKLFGGMLKAYSDGNRDVVRDGGTVRCMGNSMATAFWRGYDNAPPYTIPRNTLVWSCYRAGQAQRLLDDAHGVFVSKNTDSLQHSGEIK